MKVKNGSQSAAATPDFLIKVFSHQKKWPKTIDHMEQQEDEKIPETHLS
jgi:hypothetical protein